MHAYKILSAVILSGFIAGCGLGGGGSKPADIRPAGAAGQEGVFYGVITANQVDVSADDGSLLPERLNVGDEVFIISNPQGGAKPGWIRISRSADDTFGIGWVERKSVRSYGRYKSSGQDGGMDMGLTPPPSMPVDQGAPTDIPMDSLGGSDLPPIPSDAGSPTDVPMDIPMDVPSDSSLPPADLPVTPDNMAPPAMDDPLGGIPLEPIPDSAVPQGGEDPLLLPE